MRVLAVDHGAVRCGIALSDPSGTIARPLGLVEPPDAERVAAIAAEEGAGLIVVGLPVGLSGEEGEQAAAARSFGDQVAGHSPIPVELYDERLTTRMATQSARAGADAAPDALAAAHLLESYLHSSGPRGG
jgi:putative holliday junction resolvase